jgi:hypothetical protein
LQGSLIMPSEACRTAVSLLGSQTMISAGSKHICDLLPTCVLHQIHMLVALSNLEDEGGEE